MDATPLDLISTASARLEKIYFSWGRQGVGSMQHGITEVPEVECVASYGLRGDRYFAYRADFKGQVTFFDSGVVTDIRTRFKLPKLPASIFRRNLVVSGLDLRELLGKRFEFLGVQVQKAQECKPCAWMDRVIADGTREFMKTKFRGGLRARILTDGFLRVNG